MVFCFSNRLLRAKLQSPECINQGYVLDGYPKTWNQARKLFNNKLILNSNSTSSPQISEMFPEFVMQLVATDEFLHNRVLNLPESEIQRTHYNVDSMVKRLREYRETNTGNDTTLGFFIRNGIHPLNVDVEREFMGILTIFQKCLETIGPPRNYELGAEERAAEVVIRDVLRTLEISFVGSEEEEMLRQRNMTRDKLMKERKNNMDNQLKEEEYILRGLAEPLRLYLFKHVFPTLSQGLFSLVQSKPQNPLDALATYLFRYNPEGKMYEILSQLSTNITGDSCTDVSEDFSEEELNDMAFGELTPK
ncbi:adenylate kinase 7-like isoform X1 [Fopius arisanus]|uniref:Adenylate kinase 7-like isoform X1 n=1 Tax=Fopius arisanus TaxID=64838 RepID=A0A9R1SZB4_9HYME|nr:PREDICTED: adenylate kinase 7-like isoform X1 [Fopius arisanus]